MFLCLLGEVISYLGLFILQQVAHRSQSMDLSQPYFSKRNKKKGVSSTCVFSVNFTEFPRTIFFKNTSGGCF